MRSLIAFIAIVVIFAIFSSAASAQEVKWRMEEERYIKCEEIILEEYLSAPLKAELDEFNIPLPSAKIIAQAVEEQVRLESVNKMESLLPPRFFYNEVVVSFNKGWEVRTIVKDSLLAPLYIGTVMIILLVTSFISGLNGQSVLLRPGMWGILAGIFPIALAVMFFGSETAIAIAVWIGAFFGAGVGALSGEIANASSRLAKVHAVGAPLICGVMAAMLTSLTAVSAAEPPRAYQELAIFFIACIGIEMLVAAIRKYLASQEVCA